MALTSMCSLDYLSMDFVSSYWLDIFTWMSSEYFTCNMFKEKHLFFSQLCSFLPLLKMSPPFTRAKTPKSLLIIFACALCHVSLKVLWSLYPSRVLSLSLYFLFCPFCTSLTSLASTPPIYPSLNLPAPWVFFVFCKQPCSFLPSVFPPSFVWNAVFLDLGILSFLSLRPWFRYDLLAKYPPTHIPFYPKTHFDFFLLLLSYHCRQWLQPWN